MRPGLRDVTVGHDDSAFSAIERLFIFANGPTGKGNPQRQGLNSALSDGLSPLNVFGGIPTVATDYSPLWDLNLGVWTEEAVNKAYRSRLTEEFEILKFAQDGMDHRAQWRQVGLNRADCELSDCMAVPVSHGRNGRGRLVSSSPLPQNAGQVISEEQNVCSRKV